MTIILCPNIDDEHAAFPHRLVIIKRTLKNGVVIQQELVICTLCDHWIMRPLPDCECIYRCHAQGQEEIPVVRMLVIHKKRAQHVVS